MLLKRSENLLELSVTPLLIQSRLVSSVFLGQARFGVKNQMLMLFAAELGIFASNKSYPSLI